MLLNFTLLEDRDIVSSNKAQGSLTRGTEQPSVQGPEIEV